MSLRVVAADDEPPALDELAYLLQADPRVGEVLRAADAVQALALLQEQDIDAVFLDIRMPGMSGLQLARLLTRFRTPPAVVFVTADEEAAIQAFDLQAVDYLLKPLRQERLGEAVRRVVEAVSSTGPAGTPLAPEDVVPVELGGVTRFVPLADIRYVEAQGDYVRLHTADGSHLLRASLSSLTKAWAGAGFVRVHRSYLVAAGQIGELRAEPGGGLVVLVGEAVLPVSRRHSRELKDRLVRRGRPEGGS